MSLYALLLMPKEKIYEEYRNDYVNLNKKLMNGK